MDNQAEVTKWDFVNSKRPLKLKKLEKQRKVYKGNFQKIDKQIEALEKRIKKLQSKNFFRRLFSQGFRSEEALTEDIIAIKAQIEELKLEKCSIASKADLLKVAESRWQLTKQYAKGDITLEAYEVAKDKLDMVETARKAELDRADRGQAEKVNRARAVQEGFTKMMEESGEERDSTDTETLINQTRETARPKVRTQEDRERAYNATYSRLYNAREGGLADGYNMQSMLHQILNEARAGLTDEQEQTPPGGPTTPPTNPPPGGPTTPPTPPAPDMNAIKGLGKKLEELKNRKRTLDTIKGILEEEKKYNEAVEKIEVIEKPGKLASEKADLEQKVKDNEAIVNDASKSDDEKKAAQKEIDDANARLTEMQTNNEIADAEAKKQTLESTPGFDIKAVETSRDEANKSMQEKKDRLKKGPDGKTVWDRFDEKRDKSKKVEEEIAGLDSDIGNSKNDFEAKKGELINAIAQSQNADAYFLMGNKDVNDMITKFGITKEELSKASKTLQQTMNQDQNQTRTRTQGPGGRD